VRLTSSSSSREPSLLTFEYIHVEEKEDIIPDVDDTDGLDPEAEFEAWRLRELGRIKRDKEDEIRREQEREEIERRRALPEEQRLKEDLEHAQKSRDDKPKGQQKFLQKYWHKGAFHQVRPSVLTPTFSRSALVSRPTYLAHARRTRKSSNGMTTPNRRSRPSTCRCYPR
jgi:hypothetical protein